MTARYERDEKSADAVLSSLVMPTGGRRRSTSAPEPFWRWTPEELHRRSAEACVQLQRLRYRMTRGRIDALLVEFPAVRSAIAAAVDSHDGLRSELEALDAEYERIAGALSALVESWDGSRWEPSASRWRADQIRLAIRELVGGPDPDHAQAADRLARMQPVAVAAMGALASWLEL